MKGSTLLISLCLVYSNFLYAQEKDSLESYISLKKQKQFLYDYKKNQAKTSLLRDSWIAPIMLTYSYMQSNPTSKKQNNQIAAITIDQPIFQSGGIYFGIKYANALKKYSDLSIDIAKHKVIKNTISLLMQIKKSNLNIQRQNLQIKNAKINLAQKKEQYLSGQLDSGFLDKAIIEKNSLIQHLYDIQTKKESLVSSFTLLSDLNYKNAKIPHLKLLNKEEFIRNNITLKMAKEHIKTLRWNKNITIAKYLPRISITGSYNWTKTDIPKKVENDYYSYGLKAIVPLNINTFVDVEQARIDFLKSQLQEQDDFIKTNTTFDKVMQNIQNLEKKEKLSEDNIILYSKLLKDTKKLFDSGYKTKHDVLLLQNSLDISKFDAEIFALDKQLELLNLYEMYADEI